MNVELLAAFVAGLSDGERRELARVVRTGHLAELAEDARRRRRRDGLPDYDPEPATTVLAVFGQRTGQIRDPWITLHEALAGAGVSARTLRRWRESGRIRWKPAVVHLDDVIRELKR